MEFAEALRQRGTADDDRVAAELIFSELATGVARGARRLVEFALDCRSERMVLHLLDRTVEGQAGILIHGDAVRKGRRKSYRPRKMAATVESEPLPGFGMHTRVILPLRCDPNIMLARTSRGRVAAANVRSGRFE